MRLLRHSSLDQHLSQFCVHESHFKDFMLPEVIKTVAKGSQ